MMRRLLTALILATVALMVLPVTAQAKLVTSTQLIEQNKNWNGKTVTFRGEVIGDILKRGEFAWLQINDDEYQSWSVEEGRKLSGYNAGQSAWVPSYLVKGITYLGGYTASGDKIEVTGIFNNACAEHGGDMDIHAASLIVLGRGHPIEHRFDWTKALAALGLLAVGGVLFELNRRAEARRV